MDERLEAAYIEARARDLARELGPPATAPLETADLGPDAPNWDRQAAEDLEEGRDLIGAPGPWWASGLDLEGPDRELAYDIAARRVGNAHMVRPTPDDPGPNAESVADWRAIVETVLGEEGELPAGVLTRAIAGCKPAAIAGTTLAQALRELIRDGDVHSIDDNGVNVVAWCGDRTEED